MFLTTTAIASFLGDMPDQWRHRYWSYAFQMPSFAADTLACRRTARVAKAASLQ